MIGCGLTAMAQKVIVAGHITDDDSHKPIAFATLYIKESGHWAVTDDDGSFTMRNVPVGKVTLTIQCLGYATRQLTFNIAKDVPRMRITLQQETLKLDEVTITAQRKNNESTTSYTIDRTALDNQQIVSVSDLSTLLPGGKTVNATLMNDTRMALRSGIQEGGNASFGTAIEVDGIRLDNNAAVGETAGASTRSISSSNIESVEIVTGIPSVEYGDLSNGVVKVNTRKGKSPFIVEGKINQHTKQIALNKGFDLGSNKGILNASIEHAKSFSDIASPYTAYQRNILSLHYMNIFMRETTPLTLNLGVTGNIGGYHTEADPDNELDDYSKVRDNSLRANFELNWLLNKKWITNLSLRGSFSTSDRSTESSTHASSATTLAYIHATNEGYFIATPYDANPQAPVILGPTGYWNVKQHQESRPMNWSLRLKGDWTHRFGGLMSRMMVGAEYTGSRNNGRGTYYDDMRYAPTWREFRHDELPTLHNLALYAEEKVTVKTGRYARMELVYSTPRGGQQPQAYLQLDNANDGSSLATISPISLNIFGTEFPAFTRTYFVSSYDLTSNFPENICCRMAINDGNQTYAPFPFLTKVRIDREAMKKTAEEKVNNDFGGDEDESAMRGFSDSGVAFNLPVSAKLKFSPFNIKTSVVVNSVKQLLSISVKADYNRGEKEGEGLPEGEDERLTEMRKEAREYCNSIYEKDSKGRSYSAVDDEP